MLVKEIRKPLSCTANGVNVHSVRARADNSAQPRRAEFKASVKTVKDFILLALN